MIDTTILVCNILATVCNVAMIIILARIIARAKRSERGDIDDSKDE